MQQVLLGLLLASATAAPSGSTANTCAAIGCTTHKADGYQCQCNFHCQAHNDCCADVATVCLNQTDPCLAPNHGCKGHKDAGNATATSKAGGGGGKASSNTNSTKATHAGKEGGASAKAGHQEKAAASDKKSSTTTSGAKSDAKQGSHHEHAPAAAGKGKGDGSSGGSGSGSGGGKAAEAGKAAETGKEHTKKEGAAEAGGAKKEDKGASAGADKKAAHEHEHEHEHAAKEGGAHEGKAGGQHAGVSWVIVLLACLTGLFVPITVAIVLVLRARGVCCAKHPHQRVDAQKPADTGISIEGEPNLGTGEEEGAEAAAEAGLAPAVEAEAPKGVNAPVE
jgi:hypothetical protein